MYLTTQGRTPLTPAGRRHLQAETQEFSRLIGAIQHVLETA